MVRIQPVDPATADRKTQSLFDKVQRQLGSVPNIFRTLGHSPAVLEGYMQQTSALAGGALSAALREQIAMVTAGRNRCDYCASAHTVLGTMAGVPEDELADNLQGRSGDARTQAALTFSARIVETRGQLADDDLETVRSASFSDAEIVELVAHTCLNIFTNYFNHIAGTEIDFPVVSTAELSQAV